MSIWHPEISPMDLETRELLRKRAEDEAKRSQADPGDFLEGEFWDEAEAAEKEPK